MTVQSKIKKPATGRAPLIIGMILVGFILTLLILSFFYTPYDPQAMVVANKFSPPSIYHWLGCDNLGRDILSRIMAGSQETLLISVSAVVMGFLLGGFLGIVAGYVKGFPDMAIMQLSDSIMAFPGILLALVFVAISGPGVGTLILALGIIFIPGFARLFRSSLRKLKEQEFILQAHLLGVKTPRLIIAHILPCLWPVVIPALVIGVANSALAESGMSYLGLGIQPPRASWGKMLAEAQSYIFSAPWMVIFPSLFLIMFVLGLYFLSEALRIRMDKGGVRS